MPEPTFATLEFAHKQPQTRRDRFFESLDRLVS